MRRVLFAVVILLAAGALFFAGYFVGLPPSESRACVDAIRDFYDDLVGECREALDQVAPGADERR